MTWFSLSWTSYFGNSYLLSVVPEILHSIMELVVKMMDHDKIYVGKFTHAIDYTLHLRYYILHFLWSKKTNRTIVI